LLARRGRWSDGNFALCAVSREDSMRPCPNYSSGQAAPECRRPSLGRQAGSNVTYSPFGSLAAPDINSNVIPTDPSRNRYAVRLMPYSVLDARRINNSFLSQPDVVPRCDDIHRNYSRVGFGSSMQSYKYLEWFAIVDGF